MSGHRMDASFCELMQPYNHGDFFKLEEEFQDIDSDHSVSDGHPLHFSRFIPSSDVLFPLCSGINSDENFSAAPTRDENQPASSSRYNKHSKTLRKRSTKCWTKSSYANSV